MTILRARCTSPIAAVVGGHIPVPHGRHNAFSVGPVAPNRIVGVVYPTARRGVDIMDEVESVDSRILASMLINPVGFVGVVVHAGMSARENLLSNVFLEVREQVLSFLRTVAPLGNSFESNAVNAFHIDANSASISFVDNHVLHLSLCRKGNQGKE